MFEVLVHDNILEPDLDITTAMTKKERKEKKRKKERKKEDQEYTCVLYCQAMSVHKYNLVFFFVHIIFQI